MIFVSYRQDIEPLARHTVHLIEKLTGEELYFYPEHVAAGRIDLDLQTAIKKSASMLVFVSDSTNQSVWQWLEVAMFLHEHGARGAKSIVYASRTGQITRDSFLADDAARNSELIGNLVIEHHEEIKNLSLPQNFGATQQVFFDTLPPDEEWSSEVTSSVIKQLGLTQLRARSDDLPSKLVARYEKDIISDYVSNNGRFSIANIDVGFPPDWPQVRCILNELEKGCVKKNPLPDNMYARRPMNANVQIDARVFHDPQELSLRNELTFPEAGPRENIREKDNLRVWLLVSGGIAPGINSVISAIVNHHNTYNHYLNTRDRNRNFNLAIKGIPGGFHSFLQEDGLDTEEMIDLTPDLVNDWNELGGSKLSTARADTLIEEDAAIQNDLLENIAQQIHNNCDVLYVIGGEGSMRATHALSYVYKNMFPRRPISIIGIPKTMDNDILWVWQSFGFMSAVEKSREILLNIHTEVASNPRVGVIQLFGSSSGFVVSHTAASSSVCDLALIPELENFTMEDVCLCVASKLQERYGARGKGSAKRAHALVVIGETAIPRDWENYIDLADLNLDDERDADLHLTKREIEALKKYDSDERTVTGQTPDELRSAGLKIVAGVLQIFIREVMGKNNRDALNFDRKRFKKHLRIDPEFKKYRVLTNEPRHIIRSMPPSVSDTLYGMRLGTMAVDMAMAGYTDCMVSQWLTEYVVVPLKLVTLGRKQVPLDGIFWRTVVSNTGQANFRNLGDNDGPRGDLY